MKTFILILLFGKTILLTSTPIDIHGEASFSIDEPISAITSGASIQIDVSSMISYKKGGNIAEFRQKMLKLFPPNKIKATLFSDKGQKVLLEYDGAKMFNEKKVLLSLYCDSGVPRDIKFNKLLINSSIKLTGVRIFWKNHKK